MATVFYRWMDKPDAASILDKKMGFKERLVTGLEYAEQNEDNKLFGLLVDDIKNKLGGDSIKHTLPHKFPGSTKFLIAVSVLFLILLLLPDTYTEETGQVVTKIEETVSAGAGAGADVGADAGLLANKVFTAGVMQDLNLELDDKIINITCPSLDLSHTISKDVNTLDEFWQAWNIINRSKTCKYKIKRESNYFDVKFVWRPYTIIQKAPLTAKSYPPPYSGVGSAGTEEPDNKQGTQVKKEESQLQAKTPEYKTKEEQLSKSVEKKQQEQKTTNPIQDQISDLLSSINSKLDQLEGKPGQEN
jgi:hypothetical protein